MQKLRIIRCPWCYSWAPSPTRRLPFDDESVGWSYHCFPGEEILGPCVVTFIQNDSVVVCEIRRPVGDVLIARFIHKCSADDGKSLTGPVPQGGDPDQDASGEAA